MPRFTIGSLIAGIVLALIATSLLHGWQLSNLTAQAVDSGRMAPPGGPEPLAVDPLRGTIALGDAKANDYELIDSFSWDGGMDAATW